MLFCLLNSEINFSFLCGLTNYLYTFLKYIRQDINQVSMDGNSKIPEFIRNSCFKKFSAIRNFKLPDICGDLEHTRIYVRTPTGTETETGIDSQPLLAHESINAVALMPSSSSS